MLSVPAAQRAMPLDKFSRKKIIHWLSPLLLLSLGLHGLAMLIPIPEEAETVEEPELELPEPIQVSTLPPRPEAAPEPLPSEPLPDPEPAIPEPVQVPQPVLAPQPSPQSQPSPQPSPDPVSPSPALVPSSQPSQPSPAAPQPTATTGTTTQEARDAGIQFAIAYGVVPKEIDAPLVLTYPAEGRCYDQGNTVEADMAVAINNGGGVVGGEVVKNSIYPDVNTWIEDTLLFEVPDYVFADLPDAQGTTLADWLYEAYFKPEGRFIVPAGDDQAAYTFPVTVNIEDNNC